MDLDLINDAFCIGVLKDNNVFDINERYNDSEQKHKLYTLEHLDVEVGNRGKLGDSSYQEEEYQYLRQIFSYNNRMGPIVKPYILDIDLDCFSAECVDRTIAWPEDILYRKYVANVQSNMLLNQLLGNSRIITICREPECCGGLGESNKILYYIDKYFFSHQLRTVPIS